jgi:hypothetical protein
MGRGTYPVSFPVPLNQNPQLCVWFHQDRHYSRKPPRNTAGARRRAASAVAQSRCLSKRSVAVDRKEMITPHGPPRAAVFGLHRPQPRLLAGPDRPRHGHAPRGNPGPAVEVSRPLPCGWSRVSSRPRLAFGSSRPRTIGTAPSPSPPSRSRSCARLKRQQAEEPLQQGIRQTGYTLVCGRRYDGEPKSPLALSQEFMAW